MCVTLNINRDEKSSESGHHVLVFLCKNASEMNAIVASLIATVLDEAADGKEGNLELNVNIDLLLVCCDSRKQE